jgi:DUF3096 family protein
MTNTALTAGGAQATTLSFQFHCRSAGEYQTIGIAHLPPIVALVPGILILVIPRLLNIIVAVYLVLVGLLGIGLFVNLNSGLAPGHSAVLLRAVVPPSLLDLWPNKNVRVSA